MFNSLVLFVDTVHVLLG